MDIIDEIPNYVPISSRTSGTRRVDGDDLAEVQHVTGLHETKRSSPGLRRAWCARRRADGRCLQPHPQEHHGAVQVRLGSQSAPARKKPRRTVLADLHVSGVKQGSVSHFLVAYGVRRPAATDERRPGASSSPSFQVGAARRLPPRLDGLASSGSIIPSRAHRERVGRPARLLADGEDARQERAVLVEERLLLLRPLRPYRRVERAEERAVPNEVEFIRNVEEVNLVNFNLREARPLDLNIINAQVLVGRRPRPRGSSGPPARPSARCPRPRRGRSRARGPASGEAAGPARALPSGGRGARLSRTLRPRTRRTSNASPGSRPRFHMASQRHAGSGSGGGGVGGRGSTVIVISAPARSASPRLIVAIDARRRSGAMVQDGVEVR